jgi:pimeloyl-ACP methyl ester carboxylesterase
MLVLFVHGALVRDADWWWHRMVDPLRAHGLRTAAVELPSCVGPGDLAADAAAVRTALAAAGEPVALVGHSYGGTVVTEAGAGAAHLVYLSSVLADAGQSHADMASGPAPWVHADDDGTLSLVGDDLRERFFADGDDETYRQALARLARQDARALTSPVTAPAWRAVPATYLVCARDAAVPADAQRAAARDLPRVELDTDHHPFLSHPDLLATTLAAVLTPASG